MNSLLNYDMNKYIKYVYKDELIQNRIYKNYYNGYQNIQMLMYIKHFITFFLFYNISFNSNVQLFSSFLSDCYIHRNHTWRPCTIRHKNFILLKSVLKQFKWHSYKNHYISKWHSSNSNSNSCKNNECNWIHSIQIIFQ